MFRMLKKAASLACIVTSLFLLSEVAWADEKKTSPINPDYIVENDSYKIECTEKKKGGCLEVVRILEAAAKAKAEAKKEKARQEMSTQQLVFEDI